MTRSGGRSGTVGLGDVPADDCAESSVEAMVDDDVGSAVELSPAATAALSSSSLLIGMTTLPVACWQQMAAARSLMQVGTSLLLSLPSPMSSALTKWGQKSHSSHQ
jgi:hypothetical protein